MRSMCSLVLLLPKIPSELFNKILISEYINFDWKTIDELRLHGSFSLTYFITHISSCSDVLVSKLTKTKNQTIEHNGILATKLCTHKENVNQINEIHLSRLSGDNKVFHASDSDSGMCTMLDSQVPVGQTIELKEGAQVTNYI